MDKRNKQQAVRIYELDTDKDELSFIGLVFEDRDSLAVSDFYGRHFLSDSKAGNPEPNRLVPYSL